MRIAMVLFLAATALGLGGCGPNGVNGTAPCATTPPACATGYYCAIDNYCWMTGTGPGTDGGMMMMPDMAMGGDMTGGPVVAPPESVWLSSGGGFSSADNGEQLNISIGGTPIVGLATGSAGDQITFGYFSTSIY